MERSTIIEPTVGRIVWYWEALPGGFNRPDMIEDHMKRVQPQAAIVTWVHPVIESDDRAPAFMINVHRFSPDGVGIPNTALPLVQGDMPRPTQGGWCEWMPYQKGQAAKVEVLEARVQADEGREASLEGRLGEDEARLNEMHHPHEPRDTNAKQPDATT
jgi:hypothetical protein